MSETFDARSNDRIAESVRLTEERFISDGVAGGPDTPPYYAKITALAQTDEEVDIPKRGKGIQFYYDSDAYKYLEVGDSGWIFDDDSEAPERTGDIYSETNLTVGQIVEVIPYHDRTATGNQMQWLVQPSGGGAERPIVNILELVDESQQLYKGDIYEELSGGFPLNPDPILIRINAVYGNFALVGDFTEIFGTSARVFSDVSGTMEDPDYEPPVPNDPVEPIPQLPVYWIAVAGFA